MKTNIKFFHYSLLSLSLPIVFIIIGVINRLDKTRVVKEYYNNSDWTSMSSGEKIELLSDKYFIYHHWNWEYESVSFYGTWELFGDTLILNGSCKNNQLDRYSKKQYDFPDFDHAKYKVYNDSIVLIDNQDCYHKFFLGYDKFWRNRIKEEWRIKELMNK